MNTMANPIVITRLDSRDADFDARLNQLLDRAPEADLDVAARTSAIVADVRVRGDAALIEYTNRFDRRQITSAAACAAGGRVDGFVRRSAHRAESRAGAHSRVC